LNGTLSKVSRISLHTFSSSVLPEKSCTTVLCLFWSSTINYKKSCSTTSSTANKYHLDILWPALNQESGTYCLQLDFISHCFKAHCAFNSRYCLTFKF
jgi:hypothetical protein